MSLPRRLALTFLVVLAVGLRAEERLPGHRVLFNGDCTFLFGDTFVADPKGKYDKKTQAWFIDIMADSGVDTYLANPNGQVPWYPSKTLPSILTGYKRGDRDYVRGHFRANAPKERVERAITDELRFLNRYLDLAEEGVDWLAEVSKACRRRQISPWISIRMNDMHGANNWEKSYFNCPPQRDVRFQLSGREPNPKDGINRMLKSLNFGKAEVRDYMMKQIREVVEDYDYEGLELDWLRCPFCIDGPASQADIDKITQWHADIRALTEKQAKKIGKRYPLGLRVPCRLGQLKTVGLDIKAMARAGIIDFVNFSNFWQTSWDVPYDQLRRELGDKVAIYGVIEDAPNWMPCRDSKTDKQSYRLLSASAELLRGNAAGKLVMGVDGIEAFNYFCTDELHHNPVASERQARYGDLGKLANLDKLRGLPKHYTLSTMDGAFMFRELEFAEQIPTVLEPDWKKNFRLTMCSEPADRNLELVIQIVVDKTEKMPDLGVSFNGTWPNYAAEETDRLLFPTGIYTHIGKEFRAFNFRGKVSDIQNGWNEVLLFNGSHAKKTPEERRENSVKVVSVELAVRTADAR
jgi:hypothetical protein